MLLTKKTHENKSEKNRSGCIVAVALWSCQKEGTINPTQPQNNDAQIILDFKAKMQTAVAEPFTAPNANERNPNAYPGFVLNPYNEVGMKHNDQLDSYRAMPSYSKTTVDAFVAEANEHLKTYPNLKVDAFFLKGEVGKLDGILFQTVNGQKVFNSGFVNHIQGNNLMKQIVLAYYEEMQNTNNVHLRIAKSKVAELFVRTINQNLLGGEQEKIKLLSSMAIYRYSTYYWNVENGDGSNERPIWDLVDSAVAWFMTEYVTEPWSAPPQETIDAVSGFFSAVAFLLL